MEIDARRGRFAARAAGAAAVLLTVAWPAPRPAAAPFRDPLDLPAQESALAPHRLLNAVTAVPGIPPGGAARLVAVGERGHIVCSDDGGATWRQASVPVSADLTAVHFASADRGWAVGHGGVILVTADGGRSWAKQLDLRALAPMLAASYAGAGDEPAGLRRQLDILAGPGGDASFLDVWFDDERTGLAVGTFNLVLRTEDGGEHWTPWLHRSWNPDGLHLYAVRRVAGGVYVAGERGLVLRLDAAGRLRPLAVGYPGSFFGITGRDDVIVHGLRGHAFRSRDGGASWAAVTTGVEAALTASALLPDGRVVLVSQTGEVLWSADGGRSFQPARAGRPIPTAGAAPAGREALVVVGAEGARVVKLP